MKKILAIFAMIAMVAAFMPAPASADWSQGFQNDYGSNLLNTYVTGGNTTFNGATSIPAGWQYWQNASGTWAQLYNTSTAPISPVLVFTQNFKSIDNSAFTWSWQEVYWNWNTNAPVTGQVQGVDPVRQGALALASAPGTGSTYAGPAGVAAPVPIPAAIWLFGAGLVGLVGVRRRFKA